MPRLREYRTDIYVCLDCGHKFAEPIYKFFRKGNHILVKPACPKCGSIRLVMLRRITHGIRKGPMPPSKITEERFFIMRLSRLLLLVLILPSYYAPDHNVQVLAFTSPDTSFEVIVSLIENASSTIYLAVYSFTNPRILKELNDALSRGVSVYVLLEDHHVSHYEDEYTLYAAYNLTQAGASVRRAPESYNFMHAKYMIVDNASVMIFTGNFAKTSVPYSNTYGNRERGVIIYDSSVARYFSSVFLSDFYSGRPYSSSDGQGSPVSSYISHGPYPHPFSTYSSEASVEAFVVNDDPAIEYYTSLIDSARERVYVEVPYIDFRRDSIDDVNPLLKALSRAASRGVDVRVIIGFYNDEQASVALYLRDHGIRVARGPSEDVADTFNITKYFETIHAKVMIVDDSVVISSTNRSENAFNNNREVGVILRSASLAEFFLSVYSRDREHSYIRPPTQYLSVEIKRPSNGSVVPTNFTLLVSVNSSNDGEIEVFANNTLEASKNFSAGYQEIPIELSLPEGFYEISVRGFSENLSDVSKIFVRVTSQKYLKVSIIKPSNGSVIYDRLLVEVSVNSSLSGTLSLYVNGTLVEEREFSAGYREYNFSLSLSSGLYNLTAVAQAGELRDTSKVLIRLIVSESSARSGGEEKINIKTIAVLAAILIVLVAILRKMK